MEIYDRGWRLKALRKKRGLSQKAVADRLGVDRAAISAYERNIATPRIDVLENLALLYRTSVDYILGMEHRAALYIDDLSESQQETVLWGDRIFEKCGIRRDEGGDGGKTLEIRGKRRLSARDGSANYQQS